MNPNDLARVAPEMRRALTGPQPQISAAGRALMQEVLPRIVPAGWTTAGYDNILRSIHRKLTVIITAEIEADGRRWVHLSVSHPERLPTWQDLVDCKELFLGPDALAVQVLPPRARYVNIHPNCLHLWRCLDGDPVPDFRHEGQI